MLEIDENKNGLLDIDELMELFSRSIGGNNKDAIEAVRMVRFFI